MARFWLRQVTQFCGFQFVHKIPARKDANLHVTPGRKQLDATQSKVKITNAYVIDRIVFPLELTLNINEKSIKTQEKRLVEIKPETGEGIPGIPD